MSDTNVKIKLTADGSQVRQELRLIDQEAAKYGRTSGHSQQGRIERDDQTGTNQRANSSNPDQEEMTRELTLIRKELQRYNANSTSLSTGGGGGGGGGNINTLSLPGSGSGGGNGGGKGGSLLDAAVIGAILSKGISKAISSVKAGAQSSAQAESLAYDTYGSTLNWTDYYVAKKYAKNLGYPYGYNYTETMNANQSYMSSGGGWTDEATNTKNMDDILNIAHSTGIDTGTMASSAGKASAMGTDPTKFSTLLANSIQEAEMTGREGEQLDVLNNIADMLHETNVTVSENQIADTLAVYSSLVNGNENLKGQAGYEAVESVNDAYTSGNTALMRALGYGTEYTGQEGMLEVYRQMAEGATTENLDKTMEYIVDTLGITDKDQVEYMLGSMWGMNNPSGVKTLDEYLNNYYDYDEASGTWDRHQNDEDKGSTLLDEEGKDDYNAAHDENYSNADVSVQEQNDIEKQDQSEARGEAYNNIFSGWRRFYNGLPEWAQQGVDIGVGATGTVGGILGYKALKAGVNNFRATRNPFSSGTGGNWWQNFWGKGGNTTSAADAAGSAADDVGEAAAGAVDDAAGAADDVAGYLVDSAANVGDDVAEAIANGADDLAEAGSGVIDDIVEAVGGGVDDALAVVGDDLVSAGASSADDVAGGLLSGIGGKLLGPAIQLAVGGYKYFTADSDYEKSGAAGETAGGIIGGVLGSFLGPLGGIAGGWAGGELGEAVGQQWQNGVDNYGTGWAGDWNLLGGLWRKNGTITQQKMNGTYDWSNEEVEVQNADGTTTTSTVGEIEEQNKQNQTNWENANGDEIAAFSEQLQNSKQSDGSYDLSWMEGMDSSTLKMLLNSVVGKGNYDLGQVYLASGQTSYTIGDRDIQNLQNSLDLSNVDLGDLADLADDSDEINEELSDLNETADELKEYLMDKYGVSSGTADAYMRSNIDDIDYDTGSRWYKPWTWGSDSGSSYHSHAVGADYIPYDNYAALLHKGEMVLTAADADDYRSGKTSSMSGGSSDINLNINLGGSINGMTSENQQQIVAAIVSQIGQSDFNSMLSSSFKRVQNY